MAFAHIVEGILEAIGRNKVVTLLSVLLFIFVICTISLAVQKGEVESELQACRNSHNSTPKPTEAPTTEKPTEAPTTAQTAAPTTTHTEAPTTETPKPTDATPSQQGRRRRNIGY